MSPAAVISTAIKVQGLSTATNQIQAYDAMSAKAARGAGKLEQATAAQGKAAKTSSKHIGGATKVVGGFLGAMAGYSIVKGAVNTTEDMAKSTAQLSKNFGFSTKTASEWGVVMRARGVDARQLTMGFKTLSTQVQTATTTGGKSASMFKTLGISQRDLSKHGNDLQWVLNRVSDGMAKLPAGTNRAAIMGKLFGRTWQTIAPVIRDGSKSMNDQLNVANKYGATLGGSSKSVMDLVARQREFKIATMGLQLILGKLLVPVISVMAKTVLDVVSAFRNASPVVKIAVGGLLALSIAVWAVNAALAANPIIAAAMAIAALTLAVITAYRESASFRAIVDGLGQSVKTFIGNVVALATSIGATLAPIISGIASTFTTSFGTIGRVMAPVVHVAGVVLPVAFQTGATLIVGAVNALKIGITTAWTIITAAFNAAKGIVSGVMTAISAIIRGAFQIIRGLVNIFAGFFTGDFGRMWTGVKQVFSGAVTAVVGIVRGAWGVLRAAGVFIMQGLQAGISGAVSLIKNTFTTILKAAEGVITGFWSTLYNAGKFLINGIAAGFKAALGAVMGVIVGFLNNIIDVLNIVPFIHIGHIHGNVAGIKFAKGGTIPSTYGGMAVVGERGPELVRLPIGSQVYSNSQSASMLGVPHFAAGGIVTASMYTDHGPGAFGLVKDVQAQPGFAELQMGKALGGLAPGAKISVEYNGTRIVIPKLDIGLGGVGLNGHTRAIDFTMPAAGQLGFGGLADVNWSSDTGGGGFLGGILGALGDVTGFLTGNIVDQLPKPPDLPNWISGIGSYILDRATGWLKKMLSDTFGGAGSHLGIMMPSWPSLDQMSSSMGLSVTSTVRPGDVGSYHASGRAHDYSNGTSTPQELQFARGVAGAYGQNILELIHTPLGWGIKNGRVVDQQAVYGSVLAGHYNHVHVAFANGGLYSQGGLALVGERGPEIAAFPGGTRIHSNRESSSMMSPSVQVVVLDGAVDPNKIQVIAEGAAVKVTRSQARSGAALSGFPGARR